MSSIRPGDEYLHYCDSSHRWIAPAGVAQDVWEEHLRNHQDMHLKTLGDPVPLGPPDCRRIRPRKRFPDTMPARCPHRQ